MSTPDFYQLQTDNLEEAINPRELKHSKRTTRTATKTIIGLLLMITISTLGIFLYTSYNNNSEFTIDLTHDYPINQFLDNSISKKELLDHILYPHSSAILNSLDELNLLRQWLGKVMLKYAYSSKEVEDTFHAFNERTRKNKGYLVLIKTKKGNRFGAYTNVNFEPICYTDFYAEVEKSDSGSFLFNLDKAKTFKIKPNELAIYCDENYVMQFGLNDIKIPEHFLKNKSKSDFPKTYQGEEAYELTNGEKEFDIDVMEVFHVVRFN